MYLISVLGSFLEPHLCPLLGMLSLLSVADSVSAAVPTLPLALGGCFCDRIFSGFEERRKKRVHIPSAKVLALHVDLPQGRRCTDLSSVVAFASVAGGPLQLQAGPGS